MKGILKLIGTTTVLVSICISRVHSEIDNGDHQVGPRTASELLSKVIPQQGIFYFLNFYFKFDFYGIFCRAFG